MKKISLIFSFMLFFSGCSKDNLKPLQIETADGVVYYTVEVASKKKDLEKGLMFRSHLDSDSGMLFLFGDDHPQPVLMWMKNTYIELDMLFLSENNVILDIYEHAEPMSLKIIKPSTTQKVMAVIELNGGDVQKKNIKIGDKVKY